ncbi:hypothetical protein ZHAS_00013189 [Anopheles sinensis]|uniref:Uncharacterized protein n=1 Tax=Anopheles sinensis TaxID=74873 RepID=A0A084W4X0_ANOSI|nr:hypothetical protein ZHAS_00013189 [Anopheles sinensis]
MGPVSSNQLDGPPVTSLSPNVPCWQARGKVFCRKTIPGCRDAGMRSSATVSGFADRQNCILGQRERLKLAGSVRRYGHGVVRQNY